MIARMGSVLSTRRAFLAGTGAALLVPTGAHAGSGGPIARPPAGFVPLNLPGKVVKVAKANTLQPNLLWPTQDAARVMLERVMAELTGLSDLGAAFGKFVHKDDRVAIKPNGSGGRRGATMASNKELVLEIVKGVMAAGVPASNIVLYEQQYTHIAGTRCADLHGVVDPAFPPGVGVAIHEKRDATMDAVMSSGTPTRFARPFTDATAVIDVAMIKDHSIVGYTGCLKNITHGAMLNPQDFHAQHGSPQIARLYGLDVVRSRVRLHIVDAFKILYEGGPLDDPRHRVLHEAVYASTDPVAMDVVGWAVVEQHRKDHGLPTLPAAGRDPAYLRAAGDMGLGIADKNRIRLRDVKI
jgi:uncharacterized protein (DUF362 family)